MRILQLGKFYPIQGGVEKTMYDLLTGLAERGISCDMLCAHNGGGSLEFSVTYKNRVICSKTLLQVFSTMLSPQMAVVLRRIAPNYDIIHIHHPDPMAAFALWASDYKGRVVLHWHSDIVKQKKLLFLYSPLQRWLLRRADMIVGTSPIYIAMSPLLSSFQSKCTYIPCCASSVHPDNASVAVLRQRYSGKKIVFSLGRLVHYKGYRYLIDAAKYLSDDYIVLIGGTGTLYEELKMQIERESLTDKVQMLGRVPDAELPAYYGACDVFCLSSIMKTEAFAIVQIEAMSCGKPVVSCNIPGSGVPWVNADGVSGLIVEPKDSRALADAIHRITTDSSLYEHLSLGAKQRYQQLFTKEKVINRCLELYLQLLK